MNNKVPLVLDQITWFLGSHLLFQGVAGTENFKVPAGAEAVISQYLSWHGIVQVLGAEAAEKLYKDLKVLEAQN